VVRSLEQRWETALAEEIHLSRTSRNQ
jgi:hypothetical protein